MILDPTLQTPSPELTVSTDTLMALLYDKNGDAFEGLLHLEIYGTDIKVIGCEMKDGAELDSPKEDMYNAIKRVYKHSEITFNF